MSPHTITQGLLATGSSDFSNVRDLGTSMSGHWAGCGPPSGSLPTWSYAAVVSLARSFHWSILQPPGSTDGVPTKSWRSHGWPKERGPDEPKPWTRVYVAIAGRAYCSRDHAIREPSSPRGDLGLDDKPGPGSVANPRGF